MSNLSKYSEGIFCEIYWKELERKDRINANLTLPTGIVTVLVGVEAYYLQNLPPFKIEFCHIVFWGTFAALFVTIAITVYFLIRAYIGYIYDHVANPKEIAKYISDLRTYCEAINASDISDIDDEIEKDVHTYLTSEYINYGQTNAQNNDKKSKYLHKSVVMVVISLIVFIVGAFPFYIMNNQSPKVQKVEIVNIKPGGDPKMADEKPAQQKPEPPPKPPEKPQPPPGKHLREGEEPKKRGNEK